MLIPAIVKKILKSLGITQETIDKVVDVIDEVGVKEQLDGSKVISVPLKRIEIKIYTDKEDKE